MKKEILGLAILGLAAANSAQAANITVDGITFNEGAVFKLASVFEDRVLAVGDTLSGIGQITTIKAGDGVTQTWADGQAGRELTYTFGSFKLEAVIPTLGGAQLLFSGGIANFYSDAAQDFTVTSGVKATDVASANGGSSWLSGNAGVQYTCTGAPTENGCAAGTGITLISTVGSSDLATVTSGSGSAFFAVNGGSAFPYFDLNSLAGGFDLKANFSFDTILDTDFDLSGSADVRANAAAIPEPGVIALLGMGLLGFGARKIRK